LSGAELILGCSERRVVLEDVIARRNRVDLLGVADRSFAGRRIAIVFSATGKTVARPVVRADGRFSARAPLPPKAVRGTNRARYQARIERERSPVLKLTRRMQVDAIAVTGGRVRISGRVTKPFAKRKADRRIELQRRVSCA